MQPFQFYFVHFLSDGVAAVASQAVDTGAHEEMSANVLRSAEQLVDRSHGRQYARSAQEGQTARLTASNFPAIDSFPFPRSARAWG